MIALSGHECTADCEAYKDQDHPIPGRWQIGKWKFQRCPSRLMDQGIVWFTRSYMFMQKGILPDTGGWMDQTNKFIEVMQFIQGELNKREANVDS